MAPTFRLKSGKRLAHYRTFFAAGMVLSCILLPGFFVLLMLSPDRFLSVLPAFLVFVALFGVLMLMFWNLVIFGYDFSLLGPYERTPHPQERPIYRVLGWGRIGVWRFRAPFPLLIWTVYPSGLGISMLGIGKAFIPTAKIVSLQWSALSLLVFWTPYKLVHSSEELPSPLYLPPYRRLFQELHNSLESRGKA